jgi:hypothetical protein
MMTDYIVFWKDAPGQQVSTTVDAYNNPVRRDYEYIKAQNIGIATSKDSILTILKRADGTKIAAEPVLAREALGWDI